MKCCMCGHSEPSSVYCMTPELDPIQLRLVCEAQLKSSTCIELNVPSIEKNTLEIYDFLNHYTAKVLEIISQYKSKLLQSCFKYNSSRSDEEKKEIIKSFYIPLGTHKLVSIFKNKSTIAKELAFRIQNILQEQPQEQKTLDTSISKSSDKQLYSTKTTMSSYYQQSSSSYKNQGKNQMEDNLDPQTIKIAA